jgi:hypothetical protein
MADFDAWVGEVEKFADDAAGLGADAWSVSIEDALRADTGGDGRLSRDRHGGAATVTVEVNGREADVNGTGSMGTWSIIENGTQPHTIQAKQGSALMTPYGPKSMVQHMGAEAKHTWTNGVDEGVNRVTETLTHEWGRIS